MGRVGNRGGAPVGGGVTIGSHRGDAQIVGADLGQHAVVVAQPLGIDFELVIDQAGGVVVALPGDQQIAGVAVVRDRWKMGIECAVAVVGTHVADPHRGSYGHTGR